VVRGQSYKHPEAWLKTKKASTGMHRGLRLTVIFESYKHELEAYQRDYSSTEACPKSILFVTLSCGLRPKLSHRMISSVLGLELF